MKSRVIPCFYNQSDPLISKLGDLQISYSTTQSLWIKSVLRQMENLIVFRVGDVENLRIKLNSLEDPTLEERCFAEKVKQIIK